MKPVIGDFTFCRCLVVPVSKKHHRIITPGSEFTLLAGSKYAPFIIDYIDAMSRVWLSHGSGFGCHDRRTVSNKIIEFSLAPHFVDGQTERFLTPVNEFFS